jgi:predicted esterase YcpF (UPF0227 family)
MLIYLHGFNSTPASTKARQLESAMEAAGIAHLYRCPALGWRPREAIAIAERELGTSTPPVTLVGSSLGGFYACHLAEKHGLNAVLLNPAVDPARDLARYLGPQQNLYSGERYELTTEQLHELRSLEVPRIDPSRYFLIVETGDEVLDYREAVARFAGARQLVIEGGDHALRSFPRHVPAILSFAGIGP